MNESPHFLPTLWLAPLWKQLCPTLKVCLRFNHCKIRTFAREDVQCRACSNFQAPTLEYEEHECYLYQHTHLLLQIISHRISVMEDVSGPEV